MRQIKIATIIILFSCFFVLLIYYAYRSGILIPVLLPNLYIYETPAIQTSQKQIYKDNGHMFDYYPETFEYLIKTKGCKIPSSRLDFSNTTKTNKHSCKERAIFIKKTGDDRLKISINKQLLKKYLKNNVFSHCCYSFEHGSREIDIDTILYTTCIQFKNGDIIKLKSDFIKIRCHRIIKKDNQTKVFYNDVFGFVKKIVANNKTETTNKGKFNVLFLGVDSMSFIRVASTMPKVTQFLKNNFWLAYKGYHKVGDNTFPNLMAALTGKDISSISAKCAKGMDHCNDIMIWSEFKNLGYVTAYGEDYLRLPDTFSRHNAFHKQPTDHFIRPLFLTGEREYGNGSILCNGKATSAQQLLDYAFDFAKTYKNESFFGAFWINSHSHNTKESPRDLDKPLENFLLRLHYSHVLKNTFIVFLSDHGIRFGPQRKLMVSYYDERLPALFIWVPQLFRYYYPKYYDNAMMNQRKLVTPYNLHGMLADIVHINSKNYKTENHRYPSLFANISESLTCSDAGIHEKWCSCHKMHEIEAIDVEGQNTVNFVLHHIQQLAKKIRTKSCWGCATFSLKSIIRMHYYYESRKKHLYYVVAFTLNPGNISYEATVLKDHSNTTLVGPISVISTYRGLGKCALHYKDRLYCICQKEEKCMRM